MANGIVWVLPGMSPATINVMPKSPSALQNASTVPARIERQARGTETVQKMLQSE